MSNDAEPRPDDNGIRKCRYCGGFFENRAWNEGFTDSEGRHHYITGAAGILSGEQRYQSDGRRVRAGDKPAVAAPNVEVADEDHEEEEPIVAEPVRVYPEANIPELSERERYAKYVLGPIRRK